MKTVEFELNGQTYHLLFNAAALFDCYDQFGDKGELLDHITGTSRESFDATVWMLVKLAQQGELLRRYQGETPERMLTVEESSRTMSPPDALRSRAAIRAAFSRGFDREIESEEDEEIDLGLLELQKKNGTRLKRAQYLEWTTQILHLSVKESMLLTIGQACDLIELEVQRRTPKREG